MENKSSTIIIGAGAAGLMAAISAKRKGQSVLLCEKMTSPGRKLLATGSGRCNLLNDDLSEHYFNTAARPLVRMVFSRFGKSSIMGFFKELGLETYSDSGRIFPVTNQASSVLKVLEIELERLKIPVESGFEAANIAEVQGGFTVTSKNKKKYSCNALVITGGGKSYPSFGADGGCYKFARQFGHNIIEPVPSAVPLNVKDKFCHLLQGQRISCRASANQESKSLESGVRILSKAAGDVIFTKYGLSGTAILDISEEISIAVNRNGAKNVGVAIDMVSFMEEEALKQELARRLQKGMQNEDLLTGILPNKFGAAFKDLLKGKDCTAIANVLKNKYFKISGTLGWNEAEFTAGGVYASEINEFTMESKLKKGLYFAGEILDVQGRRGGYNLGWAWASGWVAGLTE